MSHVVTLTGVLRGLIFFAERLDPAIWLAAVVPLAGTALVNLSGNGARTA